MFLEPGSIGKILIYYMIPFLVLNLFFICREIKRVAKKSRLKLFKKVILAHFKLGGGMYLGFLTIVIVKNVLIGFYLGVHFLDILKIISLYSINVTDFLIVILFTLCIPIVVIEF